MKKTLFALVVALVAVCACSYSASGIYSSGHVFWSEELTIRDDGTFEYQTWSDDFTDNCRVFGVWKIDQESQRILETQAESVLPGEYGDGCDRYMRTRTWKLGSNSITELDTTGKRIYVLRKREDSP